MKRLLYIALSVAALGCIASCAQEKKNKDRSDAHDLFAHITSLTRSYINKIEAAEDSAAWARVSLEYEDSLDKVNFSYPADTDLLLSEGQNDTIVRLTRDYLRARDARLHKILHPVIPTDTIDTLQAKECVKPITAL